MRATEIILPVVRIARDKPVISKVTRVGDLEERSKGRSKPSQVMDWRAGETGSLLEPPDYQKLGGPWVNGKDPANGASSE